MNLLKHSSSSDQIHPLSFAAKLNPRDRFQFNVDRLQGILAGEVSEKEIRQVLLKCHGDSEIALNILLHQREEQPYKACELSDNSSSSSAVFVESRRLLNEVSEELVCAICCNIFSDPVSLPCLHVFCRLCLTSYIEYRAECPCPVCRQVSFPKAKSVDNPTNLKKLRAEKAISSICDHFKNAPLDLENLKLQKEKRKKKALPDASVLRYSVTIDEAKRAFVSWSKGLWFVPPSFSECVKLKELRPIWMPFYMFETRVPRSMGNFSQNVLFEKETYVCAGGFYPESDLSPSFSIASLIGSAQPLSAEHLVQAQARDFTISSERAWNKVRANITKELSARKEPIDEKKVILSRAVRVYVPTYVGIYTYDDRLFKLVISGTNGDVWAERPSLFSFW